MCYYSVFGGWQTSQKNPKLCSFTNSIGLQVKVFHEQSWRLVYSSKLDFTVWQLVFYIYATMLTANVAGGIYYLCIETAVYRKQINIALFFSFVKFFKNSSCIRPRWLCYAMSVSNALLQHRSKPEALMNFATSRLIYWFTCAYTHIFAIFLRLSLNELSGYKRPVFSSIRALVLPFIIHEMWQSI